VRKYRALVVEDEALVAMLTEDMLEEIGFEVCGSVDNLSAGLRAAAESDADVALLDVNLHGDFSFSIADVLRRRGVPFIFVSGYAADGFAPSYRDVPIVEKPFTADSLRNALFDLLGSAVADCVRPAAPATSAKQALSR
jgi:CheY-like chemotaxis protein